MARTTPVNSGYTIINGTAEGTNQAYVDCWLEYMVISQSVIDNTSTVRVLLYAVCNKSSTTRWSPAEEFGYVGYDGGNQQYRNTTYDFSGNQINCFGDYTFTIDHNDDGTRAVVLEGSWSTHSTYISGGSASGEVALPTIARASTITGVEDVILGNKCSVKWMPKAVGFRYRLEFTIGEWCHTTEIIHPSKTTEFTYSEYAIPLETARQFKESAASMTVTLYTYSDSEATIQIGTAASEEFTVTVPDNEETKPIVSVTIAPEGSPFDGVYLQRKSKARVEIEASDPYDADIISFDLSVGGKKYSGSSVATDYLDTAGNVVISASATNSRGHTGIYEQIIQVAAYDTPKIQSAAALRCDENGNALESGEHLRIIAQRSYSKVEIDGVQKNYCQVQYRYKTESDPYGEWVAILGEDAETDTVDTLLRIPLDKTKIYTVQIRTADRIGEGTPVSFIIPSESIYRHQPAGGRSMGLGGYVEEDDFLDVHWNLRVRKGFYLGSPNAVGSVYLSVENTSPGDGWASIENDLGIYMWRYDGASDTSEGG